MSEEPTFLVKGGFCLPLFESDKAEAKAAGYRFSGDLDDVEASEEEDDSDLDLSDIRASEDPKRRDEQRTEAIKLIQAANEGMSFEDAWNAVLKAAPQLFQVQAVTVLKPVATVQAVDRSKAEQRTEMIFSIMAARARSGPGITFRQAAEIFDAGAQTKPGIFVQA